MRHKKLCIVRKQHKKLSRSFNEFFSMTITYLCMYVSTYEGSENMFAFVNNEKKEKFQ